MEPSPRFFEQFHHDRAYDVLAAAKQPRASQAASRMTDRPIPAIVVTGEQTTDARVEVLKAGVFASGEYLGEAGQSHTAAACKFIAPS
jgi:hypothetical protein